MRTEATVTIDTSSWMRGAEIASLSMTSETGKCLTFYKKWLSEALGREECAFIHDIAKLSGEVRITIAVMNKFKAVYDKAVSLKLKR